MKKKNTKKILSCFLTASLLAATTVTSLANVTEECIPINAIVDKDITSLENPEDTLFQNQFLSFTGAVKEINDYTAIEGSKIVFVESEEGGIANLIISKDTYIVGNEEIAIGDTVTGYYDANAPMIMIYPPQYNIEVVNIENQDQNVKFDKFDENLISSDNSLKLNVYEDTEIISQDGKAYEGEITDKNLVVIYGVSTRSIPAQTTPFKIIVIEDSNVDSEEIETEDYIEIGEEISEENKVIAKKEIIANAPLAYTNDEDTVMLPLRAIAETLGYDVKWDNATKSVIIGKGISLTIGVDNYNYMKTAPIQLGTSPEIVGGRTFVPESFFKEVMRINDVNIEWSADSISITYWFKRKLNNTLNLQLIKSPQAMVLYHRDL